MSELERLKSIEKQGDQIVLVQELFYRTESMVRGLDMLGRDLDVLFNAVYQNLTIKASMNLHLHTSYDNILQSKLTEAREWIINEGKEHHKRVRNYLSDCDADINPSANPNDAKGGKVSVISVSFIDPEFGNKKKNL